MNVQIANTIIDFGRGNFQSVVLVVGSASINFVMDVLSLSAV